MHNNIRERISNIRTAGFILAIGPLAFLLGSALASIVAISTTNNSPWGSLGLVALMYLGTFLTVVIIGYFSENLHLDVDVREVTRKTALYVGFLIAGGVLITVAYNLALSSGVVTPPGAGDETVSKIATGGPVLTLAFVALIFAFNAPVEEYLFRNVVQRSLYDHTSRTGAILATSFVFTFMHLPNYAIQMSSVDALFIGLSPVFAGSVLYGYGFAKTDDLIVPIIGHAFYNTLQVAILIFA